jgi:hypothetical protein
VRDPIRRIIGKNGDITRAAVRVRAFDRDDSMLPREAL